MCKSNVFIVNNLLPQEFETSSNYHDYSVDFKL